MYTEGDEYDFPTLIDHPVHTYLTQRCPDTRLSVVNFIKSWSGINKALSLETTYDPESRHESRINQEARKLFSHVKNSGWDIIEMMYDES